MKNGIKKVNKIDLENGGDEVINEIICVLINLETLEDIHP